MALKKGLRVVDPRNMGLIEEGEYVVLAKGEQDNKAFPVWGGSQGYQKGLLLEIRDANIVVIGWENGTNTLLDLRRNVIHKYDQNHAMERKLAYHNPAIKAVPTATPVPVATSMDPAEKALYNKLLQSMFTGAMVTIDGSTIDTDPSAFDDDDDRVAKEKIAKEAKRSQLDESKLDALVIAPEVRQEIVSLLKQSKHSRLLFETWGLGKTIEYGKGMGMLFWGGPGTGKTWAANCIAKATGRELLIVNAANIQTSEPGGANRNIEQAFTTAREQDKVLFLDECDSLITSRSDVGMILSSEINTLLTQIEKFEGICILATNRIDTLDEALERRIALIVEFPEPDFKARKAIWGVLVPAEMPLGEGVTTEKLAEYALTGGQIKNVLLQAARLAAAQETGKVEIAHFESAVKRAQKAKGLMGTTLRTRQHGDGRQDFKVSHG